MRLRLVFNIQWSAVVRCTPIGKASRNDVASIAREMAGTFGILRGRRIFDDVMTGCGGRGNLRRQLNQKKEA